MNYLRVPKEISLSDIRAKDDSFSPGMYRCVIIPTNTFKRVKDLLNPNQPFDKGIEPGSVWYMKRSSHYFIRTKALQDYSYLLYPKGEAIIPINPKVFLDPVLHDSDILMAKDSNVGECAIIDGDHWKNHMFSGGVVRLRPVCDRYYFFSYLKHSLFKTQLMAMTARGATITHAKTLWLDCIIPFPNQGNADRVIRYVSALMEAIVGKEKTIRERDAEIIRIINEELEIGQKNNSPFSYSYPTLHEIRKQGRLDAVIYDREYKHKIHRILNYKHGTETPTQMGFTVIPGPSLEIKILGTRIDSYVPKPGFYTLILPTNISEYGTMSLIQYLGTSKKLPLLKQGDIVFGEAGFQKGRSIVLVDSYDRCTTNAHGLYARRSDADLTNSIFFRCIFNWYRDMRLIDIVAVGGSGGHLSPVYFDDFIHIPRFPDQKRAVIAQLYHNPSPPPQDTPTVDTFVDWHQRWNVDLGIWELDREMKALQHTLADVQEQIIEGKTVAVPV